MEAVHRTLRNKRHRRRSAEDFGECEDEIHAAGLRGVVPRLPIDIATLDKAELGSRVMTPATDRNLLRGEWPAEQIVNPQA
jgi:hypothetical protein